MKTTIEIHGYQIVIEESEGNISVSALKDDETVAEDFEGEEGEVGEMEEPSEGDEDYEEDLEDVEEEGKLESFNSFIQKRK